MAYCVHKKGTHWNTEINNWKEGYFNFIKSEEPWKYDFEIGGERYDEKISPENTHYESSILSQLIFIEVFNRQNLIAEIDKNAKSIKVKNGYVEKYFLFDVMHNPRSGCQPCQQGSRYDYNMEFKMMYHCLGNFAPVPKTIIYKNYGPRLQQIHMNLNELWPCLLKFMQDNWMYFPTKISELMSFKEYMKYTCQQMYFENIFIELYEIYKGTKEKAGNEMWNRLLEKLFSAETENHDKLISFDDRLVSGTKEKIYSIFIKLS